MKDGKFDQGRKTVAENDIPEGFEEAGRFEIATGQFVIADPYFLSGLPADVTQATEQLLEERGRGVGTPWADAHVARVC